MLSLIVQRYFEREMPSGEDGLEAAGYMVENRGPAETRLVSVAAEILRGMWKNQNRSARSSQRCGLSWNAESPSSGWSRPAC